MSDLEVKAPARPDAAPVSARRPAPAPRQMQSESAPPQQAGGESAGQAAPLQIRDWAAF